MRYTRDFDGVQGREILAAADFRGKRVLEIGSGDGFLTRRYANLAASVTAIDPSVEDTLQAEQMMPPEYSGKVELKAIDVRDYSHRANRRSFDIALFGWSL